MTNDSPDDNKKELFKFLVEAQDAGATVSRSRQQTADRFGLSVPDVIAIEREGVSQSWPPLDISFPSPEMLADQTPEPPNNGPSVV